MSHCEKNIDPIKIIFNIIGAAAATANLLYEFSIAPKKEAKQIKKGKEKLFCLNLLQALIFQDLYKNQELLKKLIAA